MNSGVYYECILKLKQEQFHTKVRTILNEIMTYIEQKKTQVFLSTLWKKGRANENTSKMVLITTLAISENVCTTATEFFTQISRHGS